MYPTLIVYGKKFAAFGKKEFDGINHSKVDMTPRQSFHNPMVRGVANSIT
jgi:hypothetical protein